jgi:integrase
VLAGYARRRARWFPSDSTEAFFVSAAGTRVLYCNFHLGFKELVQGAGITARSRSCRPRPHDLRHTFAVRTLIGWYRDGVVDVEAGLPKLSSYLGHVLPANTYWYLSAAPELLAFAASRLEAASEERP